MILEIVLLTAIVIGSIVIWKLLTISHKVYDRDRPNSQVDQKLAEIRKRLRSVNKNRPRRISIDIKKYKD